MQALNNALSIYGIDYNLKTIFPMNVHNTDSPIVCLWDTPKDSILKYMCNTDYPTTNTSYMYALTENKSNFRSRQINSANQYSYINTNLHAHACTCTHTHTHTHAYTHTHTHTHTTQGCSL